MPPTPTHGCQSISIPPLLQLPPHPTGSAHSPEAGVRQEQGSRRTKQGKGIGLV